MITVYHRQGQFSTQLHDVSMKQLKRGDLCIARYVKIQPGYGVTVQMNRTQFGVIEMCELSDEIMGCVAKHIKSKNLFLARVIDTDKKGRLMLSARESVIENWASIIGGSTAQFQQFDSKNQK
jgi:predicted RNA-binding protein with RPS1 domain